MRAISITCPNCAGKIQSGEAAHKVVCSYCGTESRIQHRTRFLERKIQLPPPPPRERHMPVAKQRHGIKWILIVTSLLPMLIVGLSIYFTLRSTGAVDRISEAIDNARHPSGSSSNGSDTWTFPGHGSVLLYDVNGDGRLDLISHVRYVQRDDSYHIVAFEGAMGKPLWESPSFGDHTDAINGKLALLGHTLIQSDSRGNISGFSAKTGEKLWKVSMGEKLSSICADSGGSVALHLKDKHWKHLNVHDGKISAIEHKPEACLPISTGTEHGQANLRYSSDSKSVRRPKLKVPGMQLKDSLHKLDEPGRYVLIGHKKPGTRVPMVAMAHSSELDEPEEPEEPEEPKRRRKKAKKPKLVVDWAQELPALDPLAVDEGSPEFVSINNNYVTALYEPKEGSPHVVGFSREGGQRLWDVALPDSSSWVIRAIDMSDERVYVSQWGRLVALSAESGNIMFTLGR